MYVVKGFIKFEMCLLLSCCIFFELGVFVSIDCSNLLKIIFFFVYIYL